MKIGPILFAIIVLGATTSLAQVGLEGFSSGRYEVRKSKPTPRKPNSETTEVTTTSTAVAPAAAASTTTTTTTTTSPPTPVETPAPIPAEPSITEQAESLFSSKAEKVYDFYR